MSYLHMKPVSKKEASIVLGRQIYHVVERARYWELDVLSGEIVDDDLLTIVTWEQIHGENIGL